MGAEVRRSDPDLTGELFQHPYRFEFFQAVRLLERLAPGRAPIGHDGPASHEAVRFVQALSLAFPPSAIQELAADERASRRDAGPGGRPPRMAIAFLGLVGPGGVLPRFYTEELLRDEMRASRRRTVLDFLDLFHHRLAALFYRAWEKYRVLVGWERARGAPAEAPPDQRRDTFSGALLHLIGLGLDPLSDRLSVPDGELLFYAGLFAQEHRSADGLRRLVAHAMGVPVTVVPFVGHWLHLEPDQQTRIGRDGWHRRLGVDAMAGRRCWDDASLIHLRIGPVDLPTFRALLPGGARSRRLVELVRFYLRDEVRARIRPVLRADQVPPGRLGRGAETIQLGRVAWLGRRADPRDADDASYAART